MNSIALALIFVGELCIAFLLLWFWLHVRERLRTLEQGAKESLDDQDLIDFQERITRLLSELRQTGKATIGEIESRRQGLEIQLAKAKELEKRLSNKIMATERSQEGSKARVAQLIREIEKKTVKAPSQPPLRPEIRAPRSSFLSRDVPVSQRPKSPSVSVGSRHQKVYDLVDKGMSIEKVAKATGFLAGEVELILNLRQNR